MKVFFVRIIQTIQDTLINFFYCLGDIFKVLIFSKLKTINSDNTNSEIVVIGNGPSAEEYLTRYVSSGSAIDIMALNFFAIDKWFFQVRPKYYVLADPQVFNSNSIPKVVKDKYEHLLESLSKVDWKFYLILPQHFRNARIIKDLEELNFQGKIIRYNNIPLKSKGLIANKLMHFGLGIATPESVIISAIALSINFGFKKVFLTGVEHSWVKEIEVDSKNKVSYTLKHFYKGDKAYSSPYTMAQFMTSQYRLFSSHERIANYARFKDVEVINTTKDSLIDAYAKSSE